MKVFLVDDNDSFRSNLRLFLEGHLNCEVIGEAADGKSFVDNLDNPADIVLMDINMPGVNGLDATKLGTWQKRNLKIIAVSQHRDTVDVQSLIGVGFKGFVSKINLFRDLEDAMKVVNEGGYFFPDELEIVHSDSE